MSHPSSRKLQELLKAKCALYQVLMSIDPDWIKGSTEDLELMTMLSEDSQVQAHIEKSVSKSQELKKEEAPNVPSRDQMQFVGESMIVYEKDGGMCILGYLMNFEGRGVFSPDGKVDVTPEEAEIHNQAFSKAEIDGLDKNCEIGLGGQFYLIDRRGKPTVQTFIGAVVSDDVSIKGNKVSFVRKGKCFAGKLDPDSDLFYFTRTA